MDITNDRALDHSRRLAVVGCSEHWPVLATVVAFALLLAWEGSGWDLPLARIYGGASGFAWRDDWLVRDVLHQGGRALAGACLIWLVWTTAWSARGSGPSRQERLYWLGVVIVCLILVPLLKRFTQTSCPWDLAEFGGIAAYVPHWLPGVTDGGPGHCFPSGHSVAAFAFFGVYFLWRPYRPRLARAVLALVVVAGLAFSWAQMARGAHYASHGAWSGWLCWTLCVGAQSLRTARQTFRDRRAPSAENGTV